MSIRKCAVIQHDNQGRKKTIQINWKSMHNLSTFKEMYNSKKLYKGNRKTYMGRIKRKGNSPAKEQTGQGNLCLKKTDHRKKLWRWKAKTWHGLYAVYRI